MNLLFLVAIPTPPIPLLNAVPCWERSPIPKIEYGEYAPCAPSWAKAHTLVRINTKSENIFFVI